MEKFNYETTNSSCLLGRTKGIITDRQILQFHPLFHLEERLTVSSL